NNGLAHAGACTDDVHGTGAQPADEVIQVDPRRRDHLHGLPDLGQEIIEVVPRADTGDAGADLRGCINLGAGYLSHTRELISVGLLRELSDTGASSPETIPQRFLRHDIAVVVR